MEAAVTFETLVPIYQTIWRHLSEHCDPLWWRSYRSQNFDANPKPL